MSFMPSELVRQDGMAVYGARVAGVRVEPEHLDLDIRPAIALLLLGWRWRRGCSAPE